MKTLIKSICGEQARNDILQFQIDKLNDEVKYCMNYKGSKSTKSDLPLNGNKLGDVYKVTADGMMYVWSTSSSIGTLDKWQASGGAIFNVLTLDAEEETKHIKNASGKILTYLEIYSLISNSSISVVLIVSDSVACYPVTYDGSAIEFSNLYKRDNELYIDRVIINSSNQVLWEEQVAVLTSNLKTINNTSIYGVGGGNINVSTKVKRNNSVISLDAYGYANVSVPIKTSELVNDNNYLTTSDLKTINGETVVGTGDITIFATSSKYVSVLRTPSVTCTIETNKKYNTINEFTTALYNKGFTSASKIFPIHSNGFIGFYVTQSNTSILKLVTTSLSDQTESVNLFIPGWQVEI